MSVRRNIAGDEHGTVTPMKANRAIRNDRAEVGVGTLIVFIAMVLVAAVAAAVLINTTGTLQQRAQATGQEATQEVSSNLKVVNVYGKTAEIAGVRKVTELRANVQLAAGAQDMDLEQLVIRYSDGGKTFTFKFAEAWMEADDEDPETTEECDGLTEQAPANSGNANPKFAPYWLRPAADGTNLYGCAAKSVMSAGQLVELRFRLANDDALAVRTPVQITLIPESGSAIKADFKTPPTYNGATYITLR